MARVTNAHVVVHAGLRPLAWRDINGPSRWSVNLPAYGAPLRNVGLITIHAMTLGSVGRHCSLHN